MSGLSNFYKQNAMKVENIKYAASDRFLDDNGKPMDWELKAITVKEDEALRKKYTRKVPNPARKGTLTPETDSDTYLAALAATCTVFPNLKDAELQNSYGVLNPEDLLREMLSIPGEYADYIAKVQEINGYDRNVPELAEEVKNS